MLLYYLIIGLCLAWGVITVGCWLGWQLLRQNGRLLLRLEELEKRLNELEFGEGDAPEGLPIGHEAPAFELPDLAGKTRALAEFRGQPLLLVFFNPACGFCRDMMPKLAALRKTEDSIEPGSRVTGNGSSDTHPQILIVSTGTEEANRQLFDEHKVTHPVLLQKELEVAAPYGANGTPSGYLIGPDGKIASKLTMGAEALLALASTSTTQQSTQDAELKNESLGTSAATSNNGHSRENRFGNRSVARSKIKRDGLKAGTRAPNFRLPRLDGHGELTLSDLRGRKVLLVFSSPGCGPCNAVAPELEQFHRTHPQIELVMISKGEPKENRAKVKEHGLTFPIVLQQQWEISRRYAMFATPVAYLIDETGVILHDVAVGVDPIKSLMASALNADTEPSREMETLQLTKSHGGALY